MRIADTRRATTSIRELQQSSAGAEVGFAGAATGVVRTDSMKVGLHADAAFAEIGSADVVVFPSAGKLGH